MRFLALPVLALSAVFAHAETFLVIPFFNHTNQPNLDWIGESLAENIRDTVAAQGVLAVSREDRQEAFRRLSIRPYSVLTKATVIKVSEVLDAALVAFGRFELEPDPARPQSKGTLRITAQIFDLKKLKAGTEFQALGSLEDLAALQTHISWQALRLVLPNLTTGEEEFRRQRPAVRVDAMEYYIRGLLAKNPDQKHQLFTQASRLDPKFSPPCFELGKLQWEKEDYSSAAEWLAKVSSSDNNHREAAFLLGISRFYLGDYTAAQAAFQAIVQEVPLNEVNNNLGAAQSQRNLPQALESFKRAVEGDPNDPVYLFNLGYALWKKADFDAAAARFRAVLQRDPEDDEATALLGRCLQKAGPRAGDTKFDGLERLKHEYNESAFLQLRSILEGGKR